MNDLLEPLKQGSQDADEDFVRYQRLILEAGTNAVTVKFHPRLTVIAGVERSEREQLVAEILGALAGGRGGTDMELVDDQGRRMALIRPPGGQGDRVVATDSGEDVTGQFVGPDGRVDLLARMGLTMQEARRRCHVTAAQMAGESQADAVLTALAGVDQAELWNAAAELIAAEERVEAESAKAGTQREDAAVVEEIERRQSAFEAAQRRHQRIRRRGLLIAAVCALGAVPASLFKPMAAVPLLGVTMLTILVSILFGHRTERAAAAQRTALGAVGAESYFGFQLQRVDRLLDGPKGVTRVAEASEAQRRWLDTWQQLAGGVTPEWALGQRKAIELLATRLKSAPTPPGTEGVADIDPAELADWLAARQTALRRVGPSGESLPLILDEPFLGVEPDVVEWMLELIGRTAGSPQVIFLTDDPQVSVWARLESMTGDVGFLAPAPEPDGEFARPAEFASRRHA